ncbi:PTS sugar transporter subunit IIA [bacterium]|nr:MAG: PTS sugar transporter subunit IIA [bacterium]
MQRDQSPADPEVAAASTESTVERPAADGLMDLLTERTIRLRAHASTPNEVIDDAASLLIAEGGIEDRYVKAMKASLAVNGPYMVIVPGVVLLHARPGDGAVKLCMSLITLDPGIAFGNPDNDPVTVAIAFAAADNHSHLNALARLTTLLSNEAAMAALREAHTVEQALAAIADGSRPEA